MITPHLAIINLFMKINLLKHQWIMTVNENHLDFSQKFQLLDQKLKRSLTLMKKVEFYKLLQTWKRKLKRFFYKIIVKCLLDQDKFLAHLSCKRLILMKIFKVFKFHQWHEQLYQITTQLLKLVIKQTNRLASFRHKLQNKV